MKFLEGLALGTRKNRLDFIISWIAEQLAMHDFLKLCVTLLYWAL